MPRHVYRDFDDFADSIEGIAGRFVPTARSSTDWWIEVAQVRSLALQQLQIGGPATFAGGGEEGTITLGLPMSDPRGMRIDGEEMSEESFLCLRIDQPFTFAGLEVTRWAGITLPTYHAPIAPWLGDTVTGHGARAHVGPRHLAQMRSLVARVCSGESAGRFVEATAASAAEQEIVVAVADALEHSSRFDKRHLGRPQFSRTQVIGRTLALISAHEGRPLLIRDLCEATGVSERTLRNIFQEYFGVGPMRLLKVRQLREIRAALTEADPAHETVGGVAARFGIWDFSLFARNYRALYGEAPSQTLRRPPKPREGKGSLDWLHYARSNFGSERMCNV
jgi:AraC family ethanolamine operon transcriptional activator